MKSLKPSAREKTRYLLFEISVKNKERAKKLIKDAIYDFIGNLGYSKANPKIMDMKLDTKNGKIRGILTVNRKQVNNIRAALCIAKKQILIKRVSGSIKTIRKKL